MDNGFNPIWNETCDFDILNPEIAMMRFIVKDEDAFGEPSFLGQASIPVKCIRTGMPFLLLLFFLSVITPYNCCCFLLLCNQSFSRRSFQVRIDRPKIPQGRTFGNFGFDFYMVEGSSCYQTNTVKAMKSFGQIGLKVSTACLNKTSPFYFFMTEKSTCFGNLLVNIFWKCYTTKYKRAHLT